MKVKKSTKKTINWLSRFIGCEIVRTGETEEGGMSHCAYPIRLIGFTPKGEIRYHDKTMIFDKERVLSIDYTDRKWIPYKKALRPTNNPLNQWIGKEVRRIQPVGTDDVSFMDQSVTLVSASKHHVVVKERYASSCQIVLGFEFANPEDWVLAK